MSNTTKQKTSEATQEEKTPLNDDTEKSDENKKKTFRDKIDDIKRNITVEPLLAGLIIPSVISRFAMGNLNLDKACRVNKNFTDEICDALISRSTKNFTNEENQIQHLISSIDIWKGVIHTLIPCIIIMFLGAWSDRTGKRKLCILMPIFGEFMTSVNNIVNVFFFYEIPVQMTIFLEVFFTSITGGWVTMFLGVFSYISDITTEKNRTYRVGMVSICMTAGIPIGLGLSGILLKKFGYYKVFSLTSLLFLLVLFYGFTYLKEPEQLLKQKGIEPVDRSGNADVSFFDLSHVVATIAVAFKSRAGNKRVKVILTLFVVFIIYGPSMAEHHILYLFMRNRLNWDMVKYSIFATYSIVLHSIGALFSITVFSKKMQLDDSLLCLISVSSKFIGTIWTAFVRTDVEMYLVPAIEILNATTFTSLRSIISKTVQKNETARVNSLFSLVETLAALVFNPFYSWLYMVTLHTQSGTVFLVTAVLIIPAMFILVIFFIQHRISVINKKKDEEVEQAFLDEKPKDNLLSEEKPKNSPIGEEKPKNSPIGEEKPKNSPIGEEKPKDNLIGEEKQKDQEDEEIQIVRI